MHPYRVAPHPSNRRRLSTYKISAEDPSALLRPSALPCYIWPASSRTTARSNAERTQVLKQSPPRSAPGAAVGLVGDSARTPAPSNLPGRPQPSQGPSTPPSNPTRLVHTRSRTLEPQDSVRIVDDAHLARRSSTLR